MHHPSIASMCADSAYSSQVPPLYSIHKCAQLQYTIYAEIFAKKKYHQFCQCLLLAKFFSANFFCTVKILTHLRDLWVHVYNIACIIYAHSNSRSRAIHFIYLFLCARLLIFLYSDASLEIVWCLYIPESAPTLLQQKYQPLQQEMVSH